MRSRPSSRARAWTWRSIKRDYGDRLTLIGNVDCSTVLVDGPVEAVRAQTEWVIRTAAPGGGFLLSTSNSVHPGVVPEYYLAMLETARAMGNYPISLTQVRIAAMQIIMPKLGLTMTHGTITEWLKAPGDAVKAEEALCAYETEKVTLELAAPEDGVLAEILAPAGTTVPAGAAVCEFRDGGRRSEGRRDGGQETGDQEQGAGVRERRSDSPQLPVSNLQPPTSNLSTATPKARALARQLALTWRSCRQRPSRPDSGRRRPGCRGGVSPPGCTASPPRSKPPPSPGASPRPKALTCGPSPAPGRKGWSRARMWSRRSGVRGQGSGVRSRHPHRSATSPAPASSFQPPTSSPNLSSLRRTIAERMSQSAFTAPHVTLMTEAEATNLVSARAQLNQELPAADKISYNTLLAALTARALREHPNVNATLGG